MPFTVKGATGSGRPSLCDNCRNMERVVTDRQAYQRCCYFRVGLRDKVLECSEHAPRDLPRMAEHWPMVYDENNVFVGFQNPSGPPLKKKRGKAGMRPLRLAGEL